MAGAWPRAVPLHPAGTDHSSLAISPVKHHRCRTSGLVKAATISSHEHGTKLGEGPLPSLPSSIPKISRLMPPLARVANEPEWTLVIVGGVSIPGDALRLSAGSWDTQSPEISLFLGGNLP